MSIIQMMKKIKIRDIKLFLISSNFNNHCTWHVDMAWIKLRRSVTLWPWHLRLRWQRTLLHVANVASIVRVTIFACAGFMRPIATLWAQDPHFTRSRILIRISTHKTNTVILFLPLIFLNTFSKRFLCLFLFFCRRFFSQESLLKLSSNVFSYLLVPSEVLL